MGGNSRFSLICLLVIVSVMAFSTITSAASNWSTWIIKPNSTRWVNNSIAYNSFTFNPNAPLRFFGAPSITFREINGIMPARIDYGGSAPFTIPENIPWILWGLQFNSSALNGSQNLWLSEIGNNNKSLVKLVNWCLAGQISIYCPDHGNDVISASAGVTWNIYNSVNMSVLQYIKNLWPEQENKHETAGIQGLIIALPHPFNGNFVKLTNTSIMH